MPSDTPPPLDFGVCGPLPLPTRVAPDVSVIHDLAELKRVQLSPGPRRGLIIDDGESTSGGDGSGTWLYVGGEVLYAVVAPDYAAALGDAAAVWMTGDYRASHVFSPREVGVDEGGSERDRGRDTETSASACGHPICKAYHACAGCHALEPGCWLTRESPTPPAHAPHAPPPAHPPLPTRPLPDAQVFHSFTELRALLALPSNEFTTFNDVGADWLMWEGNGLVAVADPPYAAELTRVVGEQARGLVETASHTPAHTFRRREGAGEAECGHVVCAALHLCEGCFAVNGGCFK